MASYYLRKKIENNSEYEVYIWYNHINNILFDWSANISKKIENKNNKKRR